MATRITVEIESRTGDDIDVDGLRRALDEMDLKLSAHADGAQLLALGVLRRSYYDFGMALQLAGVLPYEDEEG